MSTSPFTASIETLEFPVIAGSTYGPMAAALHLGAADSISPTYNSRPALNSYLEQIDRAKDWEESLVDLNCLIRIARLGNRVLGIVELDLGSSQRNEQATPRDATIVGLYVPPSPVQAKVRRSLFEVAVQDARDHQKTIIRTTVPEGSKLHIFYEAHNLRKSITTIAHPLELSSRVALPQITLEKSLG